jgi:hypothetical protein
MAIPVVCSARHHNFSNQIVDIYTLREINTFLELSIYAERSFIKWRKGMISRPH